MSNTSIKVAFAFLAVFAYQTASSTGHAISAALKHAPVTTIDRGSAGNCPQPGPAPAVAPKSPDNSVCWAPLDNTDGPGV
jgi:hypothetical protein